MSLPSIEEMAKEFKVDVEVIERARAFGLDVTMVEKLWKGNPTKLTYEWAKSGHIDFKTFKKLLNYISGS